MPKVVPPISALAAGRVQHSGTTHLNERYAAGGGLYLQVSPTGGKSWVLRATTPNGKRREIGLGSFSNTSLAQARQRAAETRDLIWRGDDPVEAKRATRAKARATVLWMIGVYVEATKGPDAKAIRVWRAQLDQHAVPLIGSTPIDDLTVDDMLRVLRPIWSVKNQTAQRVRAKMEEVVAYAIVNGHRADRSNPAAWKGNLSAALPKPSSTHTIVNRPAVALSAVPRWWAAVGQRGRSTEINCLMLIALTAVRSGEARGARWGEFDLDGEQGLGPLWTVPADRTKTRKEHRVPIAPPVVALLRTIRDEATSGTEPGDLLFPSSTGTPINDARISTEMRAIHEADVKQGGKGFLDQRSRLPAVLHGLRSTFRDWASERTTWPAEMAEMALAHQVGNAVTRAYARSDKVEKRRDMMQAWAAFLADQEAEGDNVIPMRAATGESA